MTGRALSAHGPCRSTTSFVLSIASAGMCATFILITTGLGAALYFCTTALADICDEWMDGVIAEFEALIDW